jgi:hypothetical protein
VAVLAVALLGSALAGCGRSHDASAASKTPVITSDHWTPPAVSDKPSSASFCTLVVAIYRHEAELPEAATQKLRKQILGDYISLLPRIVASAPPQVSSASKTYFDEAGKVFNELEQTGLVSSKLQAGSLAGLATPAFEKASAEVLSYTQKYCHYSIGT